MSKVLEFDFKDDALCQNMYPDDEIIFHDTKELEWWWIPGTYKGIFSHFNLTKTPFMIEQQILDYWANALEPNGLLHVFVPSWEYLCRMALQEFIEPWVKPMMLDASNQFTMRSLRILFNRAGLRVLKAKTGEGHIIKYGGEIVLEQHYVVGAKHEEGS